MRADKMAEISRKKKRKTIIIVLVIILLATTGVLAWIVLGEEDTFISKPQEEQVLINPLTGEEAESLPSRPFILSTDNDSALARPQSGLSKADIVYEFPVEGGGSRLEPIYYSEVPEKIGPVRSARPYFIDLAREYDAVFVHNGWSPEAKEYLETDIIPYISAFSYGENMFWRSDDRNSPHNLYTDGQKIREEIKEQGWDEEQDMRTFKFREGNGEAKGKTATDIDINYVSAQNTYRYDEETGLYYRFVGGEEYVDKETGEQITTANILVQCVEIQVLDAKGRLRIDMTQGGDAMLFTQGKVIKGTWSREDLDSPTIFVNKNGNEFKLSKGNSWVQVVDYTVKVEYE